MKLSTFTKVMATTALVAMTATATLAADIAVIGGSNDDAFWNKIKKGLDDATPAVVANGGSVNYLRLVNYDNFAPDVVQLIRTAISMEVDGLVIPDWVPEAEDPAIKEAIAAGITVILMNAGGADKARELGAINYVGNEEYPAGVAGGEYFASHGQKNVLCVNTLPGAANIEAFCALLYGRYMFLFESAGVVLLVAMIGAIVLTHRQRGDVKVQNISAQNARRPQDATVNTQPEVGAGVKL